MNDMGESKTNVSQNSKHPGQDSNQVCPNTSIKGWGYRLGKTGGRLGSQNCWTVNNALASTCLNLQGPVVLTSTQTLQMEAARFPKNVATLPIDMATYPWRFEASSKVNRKAHIGLAHAAAPTSTPYTTCEQSRRPRLQAGVEIITIVTQCHCQCQCQHSSTMLTDIHLYQQQKKSAHEFTAYGICSASVPTVKVGIRLQQKFPHNRGKIKISVIYPSFSSWRNNPTTI